MRIDPPDDLHRLQQAFIGVFVVLTIACMALGFLSPAECGPKKYLILFPLGPVCGALVGYGCWNLMCGVLGWKDAVVDLGEGDTEGRIDVWSATMIFGGIGAIFLMLIALAPCTIDVS